MMQALEMQCLGKRDETMLNSEEIKSIAIDIIKLRLLKAIIVRKSVSQSVSQSI